MDIFEVGGAVFCIPQGHSIVQMKNWDPRKFSSLLKVINSKGWIQMHSGYTGLFKSCAYPSGFPQEDSTAFGT